MKKQIKSIAWSMFPGFMEWQKSRRRMWRAFNDDGEYELRELRHYVARDKAAIDVGGNIGEYAYHLHRLARAVHVFEPNPEFAAVVTGLKLPRTKVEQVALSREAGEAELRIPLGGIENGGMASLEAHAVGDDQVDRSFAVPLRTLDSYGFTDIGFIKIDVEGHEEAVLDGARETIRANRPCLLIEIEERHNPGGLDRISDKLAEDGYGAFYFEDGIRHPLSDFDAARDQRAEALVDLNTKGRRAIRYVNNFLFVPQ